MNQPNKPIKRNVNGILLLDKPKGISSNAALQTVKKLFSARKAGHTGSLDPLATGMLPICFGEATKFSQYLLDADKYYVVEARLGIKTTTGDAEGEIVAEKAVKQIADSKLENILDNFRGEISQVPSMYSALKYQGRPLYELARQGITIEREARKVKIYELTLIDCTDTILELEVSCSKGTYIRTLVEDIGDTLGCGAHVAELRRLSVGTFAEEQMVTLDQIEQLSLEERDHLLTPLGTMLENWPTVKLSDAAAYYLLRGQPVIIPHAPTQGWVRLFLNAEKFLGVGEILDDGRVAPRRLVATE